MFFVWALPVACVGRGRNTWVHACYYSLQNSHTGYMYVYVYLSSLHTAMHTAVSNVGHIALTRTPYGCIMFVVRGGALKETCLEQLSPCSVSHVSEVSPEKFFGHSPKSRFGEASLPVKIPVTACSFGSNFIDLTKNDFRIRCIPKFSG